MLLQSREVQSVSFPATSVKAPGSSKPVIASTVSIPSKFADPTVYSPVTEVPPGSIDSIKALPKLSVVTQDTSLVPNLIVPDAPAPNATDSTAPPGPFRKCMVISKTAFSP